MRTRLALLTAASVLALPATAQATVTVTLGGGNPATLTLTGTSANDEPQLKFFPATTSPSKPSLTLITDQGGVGTPPAGCSTYNPFSQSNDTTGRSMSCNDGAPNADILILRENLGAGNDSPVFTNEQFTSATIDLGEGDNSVLVPDNPAGATTTVTSGAGADSVTSLTTTPGALVADTGDGKDVVRGGAGNDTLNGGAGDDRVNGGAGDDGVSGGDGNDALTGGEGNDRLVGGAGDDQLDYSTGTGGNDADAGADDYTGGPGTDTLYLDAHAAGMAISLDDAANDGSPGEGDDIHADIESIFGTTKADTYTGSPGPDTFDGGGGNDVVHGGDGNDLLSGGDGDDMVFGDAGDDTVYGAYGNDTVDGGAGRDNDFGDLANCSSAGCPAFDDTILARDGEADNVQCGGGADTAVVDAIDVVAQDALQACESVDRPAPATTTTMPGTTSSGTLAVKGPPAMPPPFAITPGKLRSVAKGASAYVTCPSACTITATLRVGATTARRRHLGRKAVTIGTTKATLLSAGGQPLTVHLTKTARAKLKRVKSTPATLTVTFKDASGTVTTKHVTVTLTP